MTMLQNKHLKLTIKILCISMALLACNGQQKNVENPKTAITIPESKPDITSKSLVKSDSQTIVIEMGDTLKFASTELNKIVRTHPEFTNPNTVHPDLTYRQMNDQTDFESEAGQDVYYFLYAYFLKQKQSKNAVSKERKTLVSIYTSINSIFGLINNGGTYFGHQHKRISAYAEYSIYLISKTKSNVASNQDINKPKQRYLKSLKRLINEKTKNDFNPQVKLEKTKKLNALMNELERLISNNFYLHQAIEFQKTHYQ